MTEAAVGDKKKSLLVADHAAGDKIWPLAAVSQNIRRPKKGFCLNGATD